MRSNTISYSVLSNLFLIFILLTITSCIDNKQSDNGIGTTKFASGSSTDTGYSFARGVIHASGEILGVYMENTDTGNSVDTAVNIVNNNAYMGLVHEDVFRYSKDKFLKQYLDNPDKAEKKYLKIASQLKTIMAVQRKNLYLLINTDSVTGVSNIVDLAGKISLKINLGEVDSDTYISAKAVTDAYAFGGTPDFRTDDAKTGIAKVVSGTYHAAFLIDDNPSTLLAGISSDAKVELIAVYMPAGKKYYKEDGTIFQGDYKFQNNTVSGSITVKTVLACCPAFSEKSLETFLDYVLSHTTEYKAYNADWIKVSKSMTAEFIKMNPQNCNYRALCYFMDTTPLVSSDIEPYFCSAEAMSGSHDMATELIWLLSHNINIDLREKNTTGTWENSYWMFKGGATMALVGNDIFSYLTGFEDNASIVQAASMNKVAPLNYEYVHLAINTDAALWVGWPGGKAPTTIEELLPTAIPIIHYLS
jgi:hypothetical protein